MDVEFRLVIETSADIQLTAGIILLLIVILILIGFFDPPRNKK
tara:strand:+ start:485 stop:613 length:129 start_codon:yes stop_codon:yes gene_type:complete